MSKDKYGYKNKIYGPIKPPNERVAKRQAAAEHLRSQISYQECERLEREIDKYYKGSK